MFASKLCHFLLPDAYPVIDGDVIGIRWASYEAYWRYCKSQWVACEGKTGLIDALSQEIGPDVAPDYPFTTKVTELCIIGDRLQGQSKDADELSQQIANGSSPPPRAAGEPMQAHSACEGGSNRFGVRGAAGYVVGQLDETPRTEEELIRLAQERTPEGLRGTRYETDSAVECPSLRRLAKEGKVIREKSSDSCWRYRLPRCTSTGDSE